ncbi:MAG: ABC-type transport auxiliary lipoprotein family protein [Pseudomonadota bacterium]
MKAGKEGKAARRGRSFRALGAAAGLALALPGCVSLGVEVPETLLTLTSTSTAAAGMSAVSGEEGKAAAIAVLTPETPAKLDVLRVPVNVSPTQIAYLPEAFWVEKPARLFRRVLGEALRARTDENAVEPSVLVLDSDDTPLRAGTFLRGTLSELSYDAQTGSVVVRYDAIRSDAKGAAITRRFEAREDVGEADPALIGPALNRAANTVAGEVAVWMLP